MKSLVFKLKSIYSIFSFILLSLFFSCQSDPLMVDLSAVPSEDIKVLRYDQDIFTVNRQNASEQLDVLAKKYPFFINGDYKDPATIIGLMDYLNDTINKELKHKCELHFKDLSALENTLSEAFKYYQYYYPKAKVPSVYAYISGLDFEYTTDWVDSSSTVLIALDMYLGQDFPMYYQIGLFQYQTYKLQEKFIPVDIFTQSAFAKYDLENEGNTFIEKIISRGKMQYFLNAMLPFVADSTRLMYRPDQIKWCQDSEERLWQFFVKENLLHSTDFMLYKKYLEDRPFTSSMEKDSPGRIADYVGWRIVKSYMENNEVTLDGLMNDKDLLQIFQKSKYKPE
jgi:hypothetical protein